MGSALLYTKNGHYTVHAMHKTVFRDASHILRGRFENQEKQHEQHQTCFNMCAKNPVGFALLDMDMDIYGYLVLGQILKLCKLGLSKHANKIFLISHQSPILQQSKTACHHKFFTQQMIS